MKYIHPYNSTKIKRDKDSNDMDEESKGKE